MNSEIELIELSSNEQRRTDQIDTGSNPTDRSRTYNQETIIKESDTDIDLREERGCLGLERSTIGFLMFVICTCLTILIAVLVIYFTSPKPSNICQSTFKRTMKSSIKSSSQPHSIAAGNINNDQQLDVVVANSGTDTIGVFISLGNTTFANQQLYSTGSGSCPYSVALNDFNHDQYLDIAVANYGTNNIGVFLNNKNGTFADQTVFSLGSSHPIYINAADFNNDNHTDLAVVNYGTNTIGILYGYGNGSFQDQITYFTGYDAIPYSLAIGHFNNDTYLDIAVVNYGTDNIVVFLGCYNGTFTDQQTYTTLLNSKPSSIVVGDLNNDDRLDIIVSNNGSQNIGIFYGYGNGSFQSQTIYSLHMNTCPEFLSVIDFNKDNALDVIIIDSINDQIYILPGYGNGTFQTITTYDTVFKSRPVGISVADLNNNNQSDLIVVEYGTSDILVLIDYSSKPSTRQTDYDTKSPSKTYSVAVNDFNNDNILDLVCTAGNDTMIFIGLGNGTFNEKSAYSIGGGFYPRYVCTNDINNDNQTDIIIANSDDDSVGVFLNYGNGSFSRLTTYSTGIGSFPKWVAIGDLNYDNRLDIVSANRDSSSISIFFGNGDGTFASMISYFTGDGTEPFSVDIGDINSDHHLDIVVADWNGRLIIFIGDGTGKFINMTTYASTTGLFMIVLTDVSYDTRLDIAIVNAFTNQVCIYLGYGNGTFAPSIDYSTGDGSQSYYVRFADFNRDNINDFVVTNCNNDEIVLFYGYSNGSFKFARRYSTGVGSKPYGITVADLNNNQQFEFIIALWGTGNIGIFTEYYAAEFVNQAIYSTGSAPYSYSVVVNDMDNDNQSDVIVANSGTNNLNIYSVKDNGIFNTEMVYFIRTNSYPQYVITCDINNDNRFDIVSVNSKINSISMIMGEENKSFTKQIMYSTGDKSHPYAIVSGDFNNDKRLDFAVANEGTDSLGLLFGYNYTTFQRLDVEVEVNLNDIGSYGIIVSDLNNDNLLDIAVVFSNNNCLGILLGHGNGTFTNLILYSTGNNTLPVVLAIGDLNNDKLLDIVVANYDASSIGVFLGYGDRIFDPVIIYPSGDGSTPNTVVVSDLNNDTYMDIVVANGYSDNIGVFLGYGNGSFSIVTLYSTGKGSNTYAAIVIDLNHDGIMDIACVNHLNDNVGIFLGLGDGTFEDQVTFSTGPNSLPAWIVANDFNKDSRIDIATANWGTDNVGIFLGYGNGSFAPMVSYSTGHGSSPECISIGDFNNDNQSDIAVANMGTSDMVVLFGTKDGSLLLGAAHSTGSGAAPYMLVNGYLNNDTRLDIAVVSYESNNIIIFFENGSELFAGVTTYSTGDESHPHSIATADFNYDSWLDIVVTNYGANNIGIFLGGIHGIFQSMKPYSTGNSSAPNSVAIADFNNDTYWDIVVANSESDNIAIFLGYGDGTFTDRIIYSTGTRSRPYTVIVGDLNNDQISDIIVSNSGINNILILYGYGNGNFGNTSSYTLDYGSHPYSVAVQDLNQDGWLDIVIACYDTNHIETLIKVCE